MWRARLFQGDPQNGQTAFHLASRCPLTTAQKGYPKKRHTQIKTVFEASSSSPLLDFLLVSLKLISGKAPTTKNTPDLLCQLDLDLSQNRGTTENPTKWDLLLVSLHSRKPPRAFWCRPTSWSLAFGVPAPFAQRLGESGAPELLEQLTGLQ